MPRGSHVIILTSTIVKPPVVKMEVDQCKSITFTLATTERWRDATGAIREHTEWHECRMEGARAHLLSDFLQKGQYVQVIGKIRTNTFNRADGTQDKRIRIKVEDIQILANPKAESPLESPESSEPSSKT